MENGKLYVTQQTTIGEILADRHFITFRNKLGLSLGTSAKTTVESMCAGAWQYSEMPYGLNAAIAQQDRETQFYHDIYSGKELRKTPSKRKTGLFFFSCGNSEAPFVLILPGGAYLGVATCVEGFPVAARLNEMGYNAFVLVYRTGISLRGAFAPALEDLHAALRYIQNNATQLEVSPTSYAVAGFSAGGHLASTLASETMGYQSTKLSKPDALILGYPLTEFYSKIPIILMCRICAFGLIRTRAKCMRGYVPLQIAKDAPPIFIAHGRNDSSVPFEENGKRLHEVLQSAGISSKLLAFEDAPHGFGLGEGGQTKGWLEQAIGFWRKQTQGGPLL